MLAIERHVRVCHFKQKIQQRLPAIQTPEDQQNCGISIAHRHVLVLFVLACLAVCFHTLLGAGSKSHAHY
jgi:hypothetical protein